jgi:hypothetical protein
VTSPRDPHIPAQSETAPTGLEQSPPVEPTAPSTAEPGLEQAVGQLRLWICLLGAAVLAVSVVMNGFLAVSGAALRAAADEQFRATQNAERRVGQMHAVVNELAHYSYSQPELMEIFTRHGLRVSPPPAPLPAPPLPAN